MWSGIQGRAGIGESPLIPYDDCAQYMTKVPDLYSQIPDDYTLQDNADSQACRSRNDEIFLMNKYLEPSAHHLLYNYVKNPNAAPATVAAKTVNQRIAVGAIAQLFNFDRDNLELWLRNGVMRSNAKQEIQPLQPEDTIYLFSKAGSVDLSSSVGFEPVTLAATVKAITAIIGAIIGAVTATVALLNSLKAQRASDLRNTAGRIGTGDFGPQKNDWPPDYDLAAAEAEKEKESASNLLSNDKLPLLLGAGALGLIMLNKGK
jgi:hypothetical protein